jgi:PAS domain S-box-containing protein
MGMWCDQALIGGEQQMHKTKSDLQPSLMPDLNAEKKRMVRWLFAGVIIWSGLIGASLYMYHADEHQQAIDMASIEARAHYNKDKTFRHWGASHGGVYVPVDEHTPPNPRLSHIPERDITTASGKKLTLMNPAYMIRQMMQDYENIYGVRGRITTFPDKLFYQGNMPDAWELAALQYFQRGGEEVKEITDLNGMPHLRLIRPLFIKQGCLKCHGSQGYKIGDLRGAVGVSVPMQPYLDSEQEALKAQAVFSGILWLVGLLALGYFYMRAKARAWEQFTFASELKGNEERTRRLLNSTAEGIYGVDLEGLCTFANAMCLTLFGYQDEGELIGKNMHELSHHSHNDGSPYPVEECRVYKAFKQDEAMYVDDEVFWRSDGTSFPVTYSSLPVKKSGKIIGSIVTFSDISERQQADEQVRVLSSSVEQAKESIVITDVKGTIEYVNPAFCETTGYPAQEVVGQNPRILKSGKQDRDFYKTMWDVIASGQPWQGRIVDRKKDGTLYPAILTISPIKNEFGEITHYVGNQQDLSEYEGLEAQFRQAQKMEALGTLVGGIAHDFNNMLAGITGNLYLAKQRTREMPDVVQKLDNVEALSFRAADMIQQMLTFARKGQVSMQDFLLMPFIKEALKFLHTSVPENIKMHQEICSDSLPVNGDKTQLHQVLMNMVNNARDALDGMDNQCITIKLEAFHADDAFIEKHSYFKAGDYAHLSVEDNGCGIPDDQIKHLFDPFFTTKEQGKGTGLGLAMVFGAVKTHHGFIEVESIECEGSTFHVYLPLLKSEMITPGSPQEEEAAAGHGEMILLVDDQQHVRETGEKVMEDLGYRVLTASNGQEAVEIFQSHCEEIDLIILDIVMPTMSGDEAARCIRQINPQVKIIFSTGYDKNIQTNMENETIITKPFSVVEMSSLIRQQLNT